MNQPTAKRTRTKRLRVIAVVIAILAIGWGAAYNASANWIRHTYPLHEAEDVPTDVTVVVNWKGTRENNLGMIVRYADAPDRSIPGTTSANSHGMSFRPEHGFEPGREVIVKAEAGRREHRFTFRTAGDTSRP